MEEKKAEMTPVKLNSKAKAAKERAQKNQGTKNIMQLTDHQN